MLEEYMEGFGESTLKEVEALRKALSIGYADPSGSTGGDALRTESLDRVLKLLTYEKEHIKLWSMIPKTRAGSTVEEYNQLAKYGGDGFGFVQGGALPEIEDSEWARKSEYVKYIGTTRVVEHPATLVGTVPPNVIGTETANGVLWMMGKINTALYEGDAEMIPLSWNGYPKLIESGGGHVLDLKGQPLTKTVLDNIMQEVADDYGMATEFFCNGRVFTDFSKLYQDDQRWPVNVSNPGVVGTPVTGYQTNNGVVRFHPDSFVKIGGPPPTAATNAKAPNAPTIAVTGPNGTPVLPVGAVGSYAVTAINNFGESTGTVTAAPAAQTGKGVQVAITPASGGQPATAFKIYRKDSAGAANVSYIGKMLKNTGSAQNWIDDNANLPNTYRGVILDMSPQSLTFRELLPMVKMDLARIAPSIRWMQLYYGTPIVFNPKKNVYVKNIGVAA